MKRHALPVLALAALAALITWPALAGLGTTVPGAPTSDTYDHLWGYWWYAHSFAAGELPIRTTVSHWPSGGLLWFIDPLGALVGLPFVLTLGPAAGYSIAVTLHVLAGLSAGYYAAFVTTQERTAALLGAVVYGASPYVLSLLHSGTIEFLHLAPLPLAWLALRRALSEGGLRSGLLASAAWTWATLGNFYYAAFVGLLLVIALWSERGAGWRVAGERAATVLLGYAAMAAPILAIAAWTLTSEDAVVRAETAPGWSYRSLPATDLLTFLHPGEYYFPDNRRTGNHGIIHVNYVGWVTMGAAVAGAWRVPSLRMPLLAAVILALGPTLAVNQRPVIVAGVHVPLPATLLYLPGSPFRLVHHPFRLVALVMLFAGLGAAAAVRGRPWVATVVAGLVLVETLRFSPAVFPIPTAPADAPELYEDLRDDPTVRGIFDFPPNHHVANRRYEALQTTHGKLVPYGVNAFLPEAFQDNHFVRALMHCLRRPAVATVSREGGRPLDAWLGRPVDSKRDAGREALHDAGYDVVVLHLDALARSEADCARGLLGREPERTGDRLEAWRIE